MADNYRSYIYGLARNAIATKLLTSKVNFADTDFLKLLSNFINNLSITRFIIEYAVLLLIRLNGLAIKAII